mmetsp:Transcript_92367/g.263878  ORF Transcript_92367/g.263878 Transcript_92367/m.263878 type:complete len:203 (+) Transcript_92367:1093-1701(+)
MYLPKRDELSLRTVLALPNASRITFDCISFDSISVDWIWCLPLMVGASVDIRAEGATIEPRLSPDRSTEPRLSLPGLKESRRSSCPPDEVRGESKPPPGASSSPMDLCLTSEPRRPPPPLFFVALAIIAFSCSFLIDWLIKKRMTCLEASVLPAPLSPLITMDWFLFLVVRLSSMASRACWAMPYTCGSPSEWASLPVVPSV